MAHILLFISKIRRASMKTIAKLVNDWDTKNARNAAKASGISMMALSLAACGGGSAPAPVVVETPVVVPVTSALTIWNDTVTGTTADDVVTGARIDTVQVFNSGDSIVLGDGN
jgi:hypothetical protein